MRSPQKDELDKCATGKLRRGRMLLLAPGLVCVVLALFWDAAPMIWAAFGRAQMLLLSLGIVLCVLGYLIHRGAQRAMLSGRRGYHTTVTMTLVALGTTCTITLATCEWFLQVLDFPPPHFSTIRVRAEGVGYTYARNVRTEMRRKEYHVSFVTNSDGFRDDEIRPKQGYRILLLGDSFTSGYGVEREEMFADLLEKSLGVEIVNAAVGGYEIIHQVHLLSKYGPEWQPDLVLFASYLSNDLTGNDAWKPDATGTLVPDDMVFPIQRDRQWKLPMLVETIIRGGWRPQDPGKEFQPGLGIIARQLDRQTAEDYLLATELLGRLRDQARILDAGLLVAFFSYVPAVQRDAAERLRQRIPDFDRHHDLDRPAREMANACEGLEIQYVDLNVPLSDYYDRYQRPVYYKYDGHWTPDGHRVVAETLEPVLRSKTHQSRSRNVSSLSDHTKPR